MKFDIIVIGAGLSGLTAASLLSKRGLKVAVIDKSYNPGGSCGTFKRDGTTFDQGSAMLFGFGEKGFNPHRFVFNCLEENIDVIKHDYLYCLNYRGHKIHFYYDIDRFIDELAAVFPTEKSNLRRFYHDLGTMYNHVMVENKTITTPDETDPRQALKSMAKHPLSYLKFLSYLNRNVKSVMKEYFSDPEIFRFYDKLTSTYCYTTTEETPAALAAVMFVDNHVGGSFYPAGSTVFLPGKLEKVIEENQGAMMMEREVLHILFTGGKPSGVQLKDGTILEADELVYSGTVWNLYEKLIDPAYLSEKDLKWERSLVATYPSVVLYLCVEKSAIPEDTAPVEMLVGNPDRIDESEVTAYILSIDDRTLCNADEQVIMAIGPSLEKWDREDPGSYQAKKEKEKERLLSVLENRFPGIRKTVRYAEVATPATIERYTNKNNGSVAGPLQKLGQHMFKRLHTRSRWDTLFCCGESTVLGTGTPAVTVSGLSAANAILKKRGLEPFVYREGMKEFVRIVPHPFKNGDLYADVPEPAKTIMLKAAKCQNCEHPTCMQNTTLDIRGILRRVTVGNFTGAKKLTTPISTDKKVRNKILTDSQAKCVQTARHKKPVAILDVIDYLQNLK
jgi:prolycopene isomerase